MEQSRGEIKAGRSITIMAPADAGDLRITKLARTGTLVKRGDVLIEFDASTVARGIPLREAPAGVDVVLILLLGMVAPLASLRLSPSSTSHATH